MEKYEREPLLGNVEKNEKEKTLSEINPIEGESANQMLYSESDIEKYVELPLREPVRVLNAEKGIRTIDCSANRKNIEGREHGEAYIVIEAEGLFEDNRAVAETIGKLDKGFGTRKNKEVFWISVEVTKETTVKDVEEKMLEKINNFYKQEPSWVPRHTMEDLQKHYKTEEDNPEWEKYNTREEWEEEGYVFDEENQEFYDSLWHKKLMDKWRKEER